MNSTVNTNNPFTFKAELKEPEKMEVQFGNVSIISGGASVTDAVRYSPQYLTDAQKEQARKNIDAANANLIPEWVMQPEKPEYTKQDVGLGNVANERQYSENNPPPYPVTTVNGFDGDVVLDASLIGADKIGEATRKVSDHNNDNTAHSDIRKLISDIEVPTKVSQLTNDKGYLTSFTESDPTVPSWAKQTSKPSYTKSEVGLGNVDNVKQYSASNPPPYPVTKVNNKTGAVSLTASDVGARADTWTPTYSDVGADKSGTASSAVGTHNSSTTAHNDIRLLIEGLTTRLNTIANSTDEDLDQMAEIVAYIKANKELIDSITTSKVSVADIVNNLTTNVSNKPLSAAQGVALKALIDAITVPTKVSELTNDAGYLKSYIETDPTVPSWAKATSKPSYTKSEVGLANVDNVKQYSASNPPPYPVTSVNGKTGAVTVAVPTKTSELTNDSGFLTQHQSLTDYAKKSEIPSKTSQLTNDSNFLTSIPSEYVTETELSAKGYAVKSGAETWTFELEDGTTVTKKVVLA